MLFLTAFWLSRTEEIIVQTYKVSLHQYRKLGVDRETSWYDEEQLYRRAGECRQAYCHDAVLIDKQAKLNHS